jgi:hypothetical protein
MLLEKTEKSKKQTRDGSDLRSLLGGATALLDLSYYDKPPGPSAVELGRYVNRILGEHEQARDVEGQVRRAACEVYPGQAKRQEQVVRVARVIWDCREAVGPLLMRILTPHLAPLLAELHREVSCGPV